MSDCAVRGCPREREKRGWCGMHYRRWQRHGDPGPAESHRPGGVCSIEGCDDRLKGRGYCRAHYFRLWAYGDPLGSGDIIRGDDESRFWSKVDADGICWEWTGSVRGGAGLVYGRLRVLGRDVYAHRFAWELLVGSIPEGLEIDHLCRNTLCVNPDHLEPVTKAENMRRARLARTA